MLILIIILLVIIILLLSIDSQKFLIWTPKVHSLKVSLFSMCLCYACRVYGTTFIMIVSILVTLGQHELSIIDRVVLLTTYQPRVKSLWEKCQAKTMLYCLSDSAAKIEVWDFSAKTGNSRLISCLSYGFSL